MWLYYKDGNHWLAYLSPRLLYKCLLCQHSHNIVLLCCYVLSSYSKYTYPTQVGNCVLNLLEQLNQSMLDTERLFGCKKSIASYLVGCTRIMHLICIPSSLQKLNSLEFLWIWKKICFILSLYCYLSTCCSIILLLVVQCFCSLDWHPILALYKVFACRLSHPRSKFQTPRYNLYYQVSCTIQNVLHKTLSMFY